MSQYGTQAVELRRGSIHAFKRPEVTPEIRETMRSIDVLGFGIDSFPDHELGERGIWLAGATALKHSDIFSAGFAYENDTAERIATAATPDDHDIVIINNTIRTASHYAGFLSTEMIKRTLVVGTRGMMLQLGDEKNPPASVPFIREDEEEFYKDRFGIENFCGSSRHEQAEAIIDFLSRLPLIDRPDRPDIKIKTHWPGVGIEPGFEPIGYDRM